jgi:acylphosphatase
MESSEYKKNENKRLAAQVIGRVQGVGFRYATIREASRLGLTGYVANMADGSVQVVAEGPEHALGKLLKWLKHGPAPAHVSQVRHQYQAYTGEFKRFNLEYGDY